MESMGIGNLSFVESKLPFIFIFYPELHIDAIKYSSVKHP